MENEHVDQSAPGDAPSRGRRVLKSLKDGAIYLVLAGAVFHFVGQWRAPDLPDKAPDFVLNDLEGRPIQLSSLQGRPVILNFWATWCGPCKLEIPSFSSFADSNPGVTVLGIAVDGAAQTLKVAARELGITYPVLMGRRSVQELYGVSTLPTTVVIDPEGKIHSAHTGMMFGPQLSWAVRAWTQ